MNRLHLSFLGKFQCSYQNSPITTFRSDKIRALLAYLAMEADTPHRRESLAALFWPENTHTIALRNLRKSLHRLRQTLDAAAPELSASVLTITRQTVQLNKTAVSIDVHTFEHALTNIESHSHRSLAACADCLDLLAQATDLYQGDLLVGLSLPDAVAFEEWLLVKREFLHQKALNTLHTLAAAYERRGDLEQAYAYALRQTALEPWREEAHRQMMRALARQGERSRALTQYEVCRDLLMTELGVQPSPKTAVLYEQIEQGVLSDGGGETAVSLHHFSTPFTTFIGRDEEIIAVADHLLNPDCRLLTIIGTGGMGKTRLSQQAVHHIIDNHAHAAGDLFPDGCYFVSLADADDREQLVTAIGKALQLTFRAMEEPEKQIFSYLAGKKLLLVLDNFEQLVAKTAVFIPQLLQAAPTVQLLISSREALNTQAEWRLTLGGLAYPSAEETLTDLSTYGAVRLFAQTAHRVCPDFRPDETGLAAIARICQLTQGVPLALEIAAAWVRMMDCPTIAEQISQHFDFLKTTVRDTPDRHRSMRVVFEQSWQYLSPTAQTTLAQLSLFHGGFDLQAALAVMDDAMQELSGLLDKSLLRRGTNGRYELHELLRQFAAEKLTAIEKTAVFQTSQRYSAYYLHFIATEKEEITHISPELQWKRTKADIDNIRSAWQWAAANGRWDFIADAVDGLSLFYQLQGLFQEGATVFSAAAARLEADIVGMDGVEGETAVSILNQLHLHHIHILIAQHKFTEAVQLAQQVVDSCQQTKNIQQHSLALAEMGIAYWRLSKFDLAEQSMQEGLRLVEPLHISGQEAYILHHLANNAMVQSKVDAARPLLKKALTLYEASDDIRGMAGLMTDYGSLNILDGLYEPGAYYTRRAVAHYRQIDDRIGGVLALGNLGYAELLLGDYNAAERDIKQAFCAAVTYGLTWLQASQLNNLGLIAMMLKDNVAAAQWYQKSLRVEGMPTDKAESIRRLADIIAYAGNPKIAVQLIAALAATKTMHHHSFFPFEQKLNQQVEAYIRAALSDAEWQTAVSIGNTLTPDAAIALALAHTM